VAPVYGALHQSLCHRRGYATCGGGPVSAAGCSHLRTIHQPVQEKFNEDNPDLQLNEFRAVDSRSDTERLTRAATKINDNLYASTALERGTLKIKSMQMTWLPVRGPEQKAAKAKAQEYMAALIRAFSPTLTKAQSLQKLQKLLNNGKNKLWYAETEGAIRYVVADDGEKGLTFAVEPIKLALSESLEGDNK
jgi:hypothetical protein